MTLSKRLMDDMKQAMKDKDDLKKGVLVLLRAELIAAEKKKKAPLDEIEETAILQREVKQRRQTISEAAEAGRVDIVEDQQARMAFVESYLPQMMTEEEIVSFLQAKGVQKGDHIGKVTGILMKDNKGKVDGTFAKEVIIKHFG